MTDGGRNLASFEFEYKEIIEIWKTIVDGFYKLAAISFTFNGILLAAISFMGNTSAGLTELSMKLGWMFTGSIGLIYNVGAICSFIGNNIILTKIVRRAKAIEIVSLRLEIYKVRTPMFRGLFAVYAGLTLLFFGAFVCFWSYLAYIGIFSPLRIHEFFKPGLQPLNM